MGINIKVTEQVAPGRHVASLRPEEVQIALGAEEHTDSNCFASRITHIVVRGATLSMTVSIQAAIVSLVTRHSFKELALKIGA